MFGKKKLKIEIERLNKCVERLTHENQTLVENADAERRNYLKVSDAYEALRNQFPINLGDVVYDLELRNAKGRYAKKNPSYEHSLINEVVVTKNNYFSLVERRANKDVFLVKENAEAELRLKCGISEND